MHRCPGEGAGLAADREPPAAHGQPRIGAGIAFEDEFAARHAAAEEIEPGAPIADEQRLAFGRCHLEDLVDAQPPIAAGEWNGGDRRGRHAGQMLGQQR